MHFSLCENNKMIVFPDLIEEYIAHGATSVVLSDAIFCKKAMSERNFKVIHQLSHTATSRAKDALCRYIYICVGISNENENKIRNCFPFFSASLRFL